jgi:hypothetical protein
MGRMDLTEQGASQILYSLHADIRARKARREIHMHGALGILMAYCAFYCTWHLQHRAGVFFQI